MTQAPDILCIGSVLWDVIGRSASVMTRGSDVPGRITRLPGGVEMNIEMALARFGLPPHPLSSYRLFVGEGARVLMERALPGDRRGSRTVEELVEAMLDEYSRRHEAPTSPYPGIEELLDEIRPNLQRDHGDVELLEVDGRNIYVKMIGACSGCQMAATTLGGIQQHLAEGLGEFIQVLPAEELARRQATGA